MNMPVVDRSHSQTYSCMCGGLMIPKTGTITRVVRGQKIRIHNAPYYECCSCGEIEFDLTARISSFVAEAFKKGVTDIEWHDKGPF